MDDIELDIELIRQDPHSDDCLRCCALMVFRYFKDRITKEVLWKKLHVYKKYSGLTGSYLTDLGRLALKKDYEAEIYHNSWSWWNQDNALASQKNKKVQINNLIQLKQNKDTFSDKKIISKEINFIKQGGIIAFQLPNLKLIDGYLSRQFPIILNLYGHDFYHNPQENYLHSILITGKSGINYLLKDPYLALEKISAEELYFAWSRAGAWMIVIKSKLDQLPQLSLFQKTL
jgi:hypothetical protein